MFMRYALLLTSALCLMHAADDDGDDRGRGRGRGGVQLNDRTYWFGNTFPGGKGAEARWMMMGVDDLAVAGDRIFPLVGWEERGGEANIYSTAGEHLVTPEGWHSWGWRGGKAVATDQTYVYYSMGHNPNDGGGENFAGVARYTHDGKPAPFAGAQSGHRLAVNADHHHQPTGLAVGDGELFVADLLHQRIVVYATADLRQLREFPFVNPGRMVIDATPDKALWVIDTAANTVHRLSRDGRDLKVRINDCLMPVALAVTPEGDLLIADSDPSRQRIQRYRMPSGARVAGADFGSPIYQGPTPGVVTPGRFFRITGLACGADGSLYVSSWDYGGKLWRFDAQRSLVWVREGLEFVNCADADPADDTSIYSTGHRYVIDYTIDSAIDSAKPRGANWRHAAITLDPLRFPDDPRLRVDRGMAMRMLRISGKKVMFGKPQMDSSLFAWRFDGEIAVPAAIYSPHGLKSPDTESGWLAGHPEGPFIWMDSNGGRAPASG